MQKGSTENWWALVKGLRTYLWVNIPTMLWVNMPNGVK
jgi:hypothetical protein